MSDDAYMTQPAECDRHTDIERESKYAAAQTWRTVIAALNLDEEAQLEVEREVATCPACSYRWMRNILGLAAGLLEGNRGGTQQALAYAQEQLDLVLNSPDILNPPDAT